MMTSLRSCRSRRASLGVLFAVCTASLSCGAKKGDTSMTSRTPNSRPVVVAEPEPGLTLRLSDGEAVVATEQVPLADAKPLGEAETRAMLARLRPIAVAAEDRRDHVLRDGPKPPPRAGATVETPFPPPAAPALPATGAAEPLAVVRMAPQGPVPLAPHVSVTFSAPMVAVTGQNQAAASVPVTLTPSPPGTWRWLGTRTVIFSGDGRLPQATEYRVEVPATTRAANGAVIGTAAQWTFRTPPPTIEASYPTHGPQRRDTKLLVRFDQRVDPAAILEHLRVTADSQSFAVRALTEAERAAEPIASRLARARAQGHEERVVAFATTSLLPKDATVKVTVAAGAPSAEGPLVTEKPQSWSFRTYPPLRVAEARCGWGNQCPPLSPWTVRMNNPLAGDLDPATIDVRPALPGLRVEVLGDTIMLQGRSAGRTTYTVTLPASLRDEFEQELGRATEVTFRVGDAQPSLSGPTQPMVVLDPAAERPSFAVYSINHPKLRVRLYGVTPADWPAWQEYLRSPYIKGKRQTPPGKRVVDTVVEPRGPRDTLLETAIDLQPALPSGHGHVIAVVEPKDAARGDARVQAWVQATAIGLDAFVDDGELIGWASRLSDGASLPGVQLEIQPYGATAVTAADGTARITLPDRGQKSGSGVLLARQGDDVAMLPEDIHPWNQEGSWYRNRPATTLQWLVWDDRQMYRPGEHVHLKGWLRRIDWGEGGDLQPLDDAVSAVAYQAYDPLGNELASGRIDVSAAGGFDLELELPKTPNLGYARVELRPVGAKEESYSHSFQIQEFRRPEFEVVATASQGPHLVGQTAELTATASYYAGGGLSGAAVRWTVTASPTSFSPPGHDDFQFGVWVPWWGFGRGMPSEDQSRRYRHEARTDANGEHVLAMELVAANPPQPMSVVAEAVITDVNRQAQAARTTMLVHPAAHYVGLRTSKLFVDEGSEMVIEAIAVDHEGMLLTGRTIEMRAVRLDWGLENGEWSERERDEQQCTITSRATPDICRFKPAEGGQHRISARIRDEKGRVSESQLTVWVAGGKSPPARGVEMETVELIPDAKEYAPGATAKILIQAPFVPAEALLTVRRSGIVSTRRFAMTKPSMTVEVPITAAYVPNVFVQLDLIGAAARTDEQGRPQQLPKRPAYASGQLELAVPPTDRRLEVRVDPAARKLAPGAKTELGLEVLDARGRPVGDAEIAVVVVDEAVLALTGYQYPDPLAAFHPQRGPGARDHHLRAAVTLAQPPSELQAEVEEAAMGADMMAAAPAAPPMARMAAKSSAGGAAPTPIAVRENFDALAYFAPAIRTNAAGRARVTITMPDNLTRYRVVAMSATAGRQFGKGESSITARLPLMVRPSPPRFLNYGDRFSLPVVLQNQTDAPMEVRVAARAANAMLAASSGRILTIPANDRREVRFAATTEQAGIARFQIAAAAGGVSDAAEVALPVYTPATTEAFATYGELERGALRQPVAAPGDAIANFGGLEITTSSTQLQALTDALVYLVEYPYDCTEQVASRILAVAALRQVLAEFTAKDLPPPEEIEAAVGRDLERLATLQQPDGGFGFWPGSQRSWPYVSVHAAHALLAAKREGYAVSAEALERSRRYLTNIEKHFSAEMHPSVRHSILAYALATRRRMGKGDPQRAKRLLEEVGVDKLPLEALGWILSSLQGESSARAERAAILRQLGNRVSETAAAAHWTTSYSDDAHLLLHSNRRTDAIILDALIAEAPKSDLIAKVVRGLLAHRTRGRWENTQENAFVLLALRRYFDVYEGVTPNFVARLWLGERFAGEHRFTGRTTDRQHVTIPMATVAAAGKAPVTIDKSGAGRLYYRIGMSYAPRDLRLEAADYGFAVERRYEPLDAPSDVQRDTDGSWRIRAGARVRVRVNMVAPSRRYHVALVDPLPAGLEVLNPALAVTEELPADPAARNGYWWWWRPWYEHQNVRDERVEAFTSLLAAGVYEYSYVARATTPGQFVVPPAKAEEMYAPETFGRSASDRVVVAAEGAAAPAQIAK